MDSRRTQRTTSSSLRDSPEENGVWNYKLQMLDCHMNVGYSSGHISTRFSIVFNNFDSEENEDVGGTTSIDHQKLFLSSNNNNNTSRRHRPKMRLKLRLLKFYMD